MSPKRPRTPPVDMMAAVSVYTPGKNAAANLRLTEKLRDLNDQFGLGLSVEPTGEQSGDGRTLAYLCRNAICRHFWSSEPTLDSRLEMFRSLPSGDHNVSNLHGILTSDESKDLTTAESRRAKRFIGHHFRPAPSFIAQTTIKDRVTSFESDAPPEIFSSQELSTQGSANTSAMTSFTHSILSTASVSPDKRDLDNDQTVKLESDLVAGVCDDVDPFSSYVPSPPPSPSPVSRGYSRLEGYSTSQQSSHDRESAGNPSIPKMRADVIQPSLLTEQPFPTEKLQSAIEVQPPEKAVEVQCEDYRSKSIPSAGFFCEPLPQSYHTLPLRVRHECLRFAVHFGMSLPDSLPLTQDAYDDRERMAQFLLEFARTSIGNHNGQVPEKTSPLAWSHSQEGAWSPEVMMSGCLHQEKFTGRTAFRLHINPLDHQDRSNRFFRKFGAHRFFKLMVPAAARTKDYPDHTMVERRLRSWLNVPDKPFLGCMWTVLFTRPSRATKRAKQRQAKEDRREVMLFATTGPGLAPIARAEILEWFLPLAPNAAMTACKTFARLELGFSTTFATIAFEPNQVIEVEDRYGDGAAEDLSLNDLSLDWTGVYDPQEPRVMDDGCSIISYAAATKVWELLGQDGRVPSAFQARIGQWKGMWSVDPRQSDDVWIKTSASQRKWRRPVQDRSVETSDPLQLTFEVLTWTKRLTSSKLYFDHLPILQHRGVPTQVFEKAVLAKFKTEVAEAERACSDPMDCARWIQTKKASMTTGESIRGSPKKVQDLAITLIKKGFELSKCAYLARLMDKILTWHFTDISNDLRIDIAESTSVLGIADPTGALGPSEIHLCFSHPVGGVPFLDGVDALVSRHPSLRASDVQRVHTIVKPELKHLHDVVVFPVTGSYPLAGKLQGGDYDGDTFWVCWDKTMVETFENAPPPAQAPQPENFNIEVDRTTYAQNGVDDFFRRSFEFQWQTSFLGQCTNFHEELRYILPLDHRCVSEIADIHDLIIDSSKNGYVYTSTAWSRQRNLAYYPRNVKRPLYKEADDLELFKPEPKPHTENIVDHLIFTVARERSRQIIGTLRRHWLGCAETWDPSLSDLYSDTNKKFDKHDAIQHTFATVLKDLKEKVNSLWVQTSREVDKGKTLQFSKGEIESRREMRHLECLRRYESLGPSDDIRADPVIAAWFERAGRYSFCHWDFLKASLLYHEFHAKPAFVFAVAFKELCELKARSLPGSDSAVSSYWVQCKLRKRSHAVLVLDQRNKEMNQATKLQREAVKLEDEIEMEDASLIIQNPVFLSEGQRSPQLFQEIEDAPAQAGQTDPVMSGVDLRSISPPPLKRPRQYHTDDRSHSEATMPNPPATFADARQSRNSMNTDDDQVFADASQDWSEIELQSDGFSQWVV